MKFLIVFAVLIVAALCAPPSNEDPKYAQIVRSSFDNIGTDGYRFDYAQTDGQSRQEEAVVNNLESENPELAVRGSAEWYVDGVKYVLNYIADKDGFRAEGDHLPKN